jgi:hypothetical protein
MPFYPANHRPTAHPSKNVRELPIRVRIPGTSRYRPVNAAIDASRQASLISDVYASQLGLYVHGNRPSATEIVREKLKFQLVNNCNGVGQRSTDFSLAFDVVDSTKLSEYQPTSVLGSFQIQIVLSREFLEFPYIKTWRERRLANSNLNVLVIELHPEYCQSFPPLVPSGAQVSSP